MRTLRGPWRMGRWLLDSIRHGMAWSLATWVSKGLEYVIPPISFCFAPSRWVAGAFLGIVR